MNSPQKFVFTLITDIRFYESLLKKKNLNFSRGDGQYLIMMFRIYATLWFGKNITSRNIYLRKVLKTGGPHKKL